MIFVSHACSSLPVLHYEFTLTCSIVKVGLVPVRCNMLNLCRCCTGNRSCWCVPFDPRAFSGLSAALYFNCNPRCPPDPGSSHTHTLDPPPKAPQVTTITTLLPKPHVLSLSSFSYSLLSCPQRGEEKRKMDVKMRETMR